MPRFLYLFAVFILIDILSTLFDNEVWQYAIRTVLAFSVCLFYLSKKKQLNYESFFVFFLILITLLSDILFLRFREHEVVLLSVIMLKELGMVLLIYQEPTTVLPKFIKVLGQLLIYLCFCLLIFVVLVSSKVIHRTMLGFNFALMAAVFTFASFRKVNNDSFKAVFLGLFLFFFAGIFGLINYQESFHSFAHVIDRVMNDLGLFFVAYGYTINHKSRLIP